MTRAVFQRNRWWQNGRKFFKRRKVIVFNFTDCKIIIIVLIKKMSRNFIIILFALFPCRPEAPLLDWEPLALMEAIVVANKLYERILTTWRGGRDPQGDGNLNVTKCGLLHECSLMTRRSSRVNI